MFPLKLQIALYIAINLLALYTLTSAINIFLKPKESFNLFSKIVSFIIYFVIGVLTYFWNFIPYINIILQVILVVIITTYYVGSLKIKLTIACFWTTFRMIIELIIGIIYGILLKTTLSEAAFNDISNMIISIICTLVTLVIVKSFQLFKWKQELSEKILFIDSLQVSIIPICSIIIMYSFIEVALSSYISYWMVVISLILIALINIFFYYLFDRLRKIEKVKYENELLKNQSQYYIELEKNINATFEKIVTIKHDLKHHLLYLRAKTEENTTEALNEISKQMDLLIGEVLSDNNKIYTKNKNINRILNYKLYSVYKNNIDVDIKVNIREDTYMDEQSIYIILGNIIDNAATNFNSSESLEKKLLIRIFDDHNNLFIKIRNPYIGKIIFRNGLPITTKENKGMHGIGLKSVKKIVEDKNGYFKITTSDYIFDVEILLYDEIKSKVV